MVWVVEWTNPSSGRFREVVELRSDEELGSYLDHMRSLGFLLSDMEQVEP